MLKNATAREELYIGMIRTALLELAKLRGNPEHIGAGIRIGLEDHPPLYLYLTNSKAEPKENEEWLLTRDGNVSTAFLYHTIDTKKLEDRDDNPRASFWGEEVSHETSRIP